MGAIHLTTDQFKKRVSDIDAGGDWKFLGDKPAIIDFYASWCGPCKRLSPILDELAEEYAGNRAEISAIGKEYPVAKKLFFQPAHMMNYQTV